MFEEESKEYANKWLEHVKDLELEHKTDEKPEYIRIKEAHQYGAELGYNKAKEDADKMKSRFLELCNLKDMRIAELEKANEWHDLRKDPNDLPKAYTDVWCDYGDGYGKGFYHKADNGWWIEGHLYCSTIDAWCELPKYPKENE